MLLFKRLLTTLGFFVVFFFVMFFSSMVVGGAVAGSQAGSRNHAQTFDEGYAAGRQAGRVFAVKWRSTVAAGALGVALVGAFGLSFSGTLPWCRREPLPPPLPPTVT